MKLIKSNLASFWCVVGSLKAERRIECHKMTFSTTCYPKNDFKMKAQLLWWDNADIFDDSGICSILVHCIALPCNVLHCIALHCIVWLCTMCNPKSTSAQSQITSWHTFIRPRWSNMYRFHFQFLPFFEIFIKSNFEGQSQSKSWPAISTIVSG